MKKAWRNDAYSKVTGRAQFTDDMKLQGMLHCVPVYSQKYIHCKIKGLTGLEEAAAIKGVVRVITHKDITGKANFGQIVQDYFMLAVDRIRCEGDVIALVVAESREQAIEAATLIEVIGEELPLLLDPQQAMADEKNLIHPGKGSNIINHHKIRRGGDIDTILADCDKVLQRSYYTGHVEHGYLEAETALCHERPDGVMEVRGSMQHPFSTRRFVASLLGCPLADVEIVGNPTGGGFGGKDDTAAMVCARAALAAKLCGKPVKMTYQREWSIRESYKRHPYKLEYTIGLKGKMIHAVKVKMLADGGAYTSVTPWVTWRSTVQCCGPYQVENVHCDVYGVHTNNIFTGAMRGFGAPQVNFSVEQWVEDCAQALDMDPLEFRRINMVTQDCETITHQKLDNHIVSLEEVMDKALEISDYVNKSKQNSHGSFKSKQSFSSGKSDAPVADDKLYGIGLAISYRGCSLGAEGMDFCSAIINCQFDGSILLEVGIHENGQGAESAMIKLLQRELGVKQDRIRYNRPSTSHIPDGGTTVASRGTLMGGGAVVHAVENLKKIIASSVYEKLQCSVEEVKIDQDKVYGPRVTMSWEEAMHQMFLNSDYPYAFGVFQAPKVDWDEETGRGNAYFTWGYSCQIAEVEVDLKQGKVQLIGVSAVHDAGKVVDMDMIKGQVYGGFTQGYGMGIMEDIGLKEGRIVHNNFNKYKIPRSTDMPDFKVEFIQNPDPNSPSGAKGIGEPALEIAAAATANALHNALGKRFDHYPMILEKEK
jgi:CO/xanthine dehydrogenase Mo-binding subunit